IDVHRIDVRVGQQLLVAGVPRGDAETITTGIELGLVAAANRLHLGVRVPLVDRNELRAETEADDPDPHLAIRQRGLPPRDGWRSLRGGRRGYKATRRRGGEATRLRGGEAARLQGCEAARLRGSAGPEDRDQFAPAHCR